MISDEVLNQKRKIDIIEYTPDMGVYSKETLEKIGLKPDMSIEDQMRKFVVRNEPVDDPDPYREIKEYEELADCDELYKIICKDSMIVGFEMGYPNMGNNEVILLSDNMKHRFYTMELAFFSGDQNDTKFDYYDYIASIIPRN